MTTLVLVTLVAFSAYSLASKPVARSLLTLPILFAGPGLLLSQTMAHRLAPGRVHEASGCRPR